MNIRLIASAVLCGFVLFCPSGGAWAAPGTETETTQRFRWSPVEKGFAMGRYELDQGIKVIKSEVLLLKFSPKYFDFEAIGASILGETRSDVRSITKKSSGIAGINAHFFDPSGKPLGLLISNKKKLKRIHKGGGLLTGIFYIEKGKPYIVERSKFSAKHAVTALQSGPRLLINGKAKRVSTKETRSRRSGVAITKDGDVILFATMLRFPGASFEQLQQMLLDPALKVVDALNLDGGGSSQLFVEKNLRIADETFISGGDIVPVALIAKRKKRKGALKGGE